MLPVCFLIIFNTGIPRGVDYTRIVGVSYPGVVLGQRVSHITVEKNAKKTINNKIIIILDYIFENVNFTIIKIDNLNQKVFDIFLFLNLCFLSSSISISIHRLY